MRLNKKTDDAKKTSDASTICGTEVHFSKLLRTKSGRIKIRQFFKKENENNGKKLFENNCQKIFENNSQKLFVE